MPSEAIHIQLDIAIIGGGIAGLWLANRCKTLGFDVALFEQTALGSDQTIASQGMIHGGMKYTLSGALTGASETIADMPNHWRACLCGEGDVDLRNTRVLSEYFYLWSGNSISDKLSSFLASKAIHGRVDPVPEDRRPPLLRHADFGGNLYKLVDIVIDVHSLVTNLAHNVEAHCFQIDWSQSHWETNNGELCLVLKRDEQTYYIHAQKFIFSAGKGNGAMLSQLGIESPAMQLRPLQQVMVKHVYPYSFFGHCLGTDTTPRLTISSHKLNPTEQVWYLGGSLAEKGVAMDEETLVAAAQAELAELLPWVNLNDAEWKTLRIDRAEPLQPGFLRPENAFAENASGLSNLIVAWPTKLTLAPNLANKIAELLRYEDIKPSTQGNGSAQLKAVLPLPPIAPTPWEIAFPPAKSAEEMLEMRFSEPVEEDEDK